LRILSTDQNIDAILIDMMMPEMDGYDAIPLIKALPDRRSTFVIAVTAQAMIGDKEKCLDAGADDYISKPVDVDKLLLILSKI
jgi:CheY-like chemotaxis protein